MLAKVSIIMGSTSDMPVMEGAAQVLNDFKIPFEINALSAHRTPEKVMEFASGAYERGIRVFIAGAGGAAHLPGVIAALTPLPVIGVPINSSNFARRLGFNSFHTANAFRNTCGYGCNGRSKKCRNSGCTDTGHR
jgi:phosphoribosylaminoimidazole carboxylase PurE protein